MNENIREADLRALYKFLNHEGHYSRVGALDVSTKDFKQEFIKGEEVFIEYCKKWNGKRNVFIGRNPRDISGHVIGSFAITFDIDPVRPKGEASTNEQHNNALNAGRAILSKYAGGYLASSGNGCLLLYAVPSGIKDLEAYYRKEGQLIDELQKLVEKFNVKIDSTNYDESIIKAIGTMSTKGKDNERRCSRFLISPMAPYRVSHHLQERIKNLETVREISSKSIQGDPVKRIADAKKFLSLIGKEVANDYDSWLKVGMALKEFGVAGLSLWKEWSKQSEKYEEGVCEEKWKTFDEVPSYTLSSLAYLAKRNSSRVGDLREFSGVKQTSKVSYFDRLFQPNSGSEELIRTGIESLDAYIQQMPRGEVTTIAARSGYGKTSMACSIAENLRKQGKKVLYFSTELQQDLIMHKVLGVACSVSLQSLLTKTFTKDEGERIRNFEGELLRTPLVMNDEYQPSIELIRQEVQEHKPDLIIIDHVTHMAHHWEEVSQLMRDLKQIAIESNSVVLCLIQLGEPGRDKNGGEAQSIRGDVRGSQEVIFLSALFMFLSNPYEVKGSFQPVDVHIAKNRWGLAGVIAPVTVHKETGLFVSREDKHNATDL